MRGTGIMVAKRLLACLTVILWPLMAHADCDPTLNSPTTTSRAGFTQGQTNSCNWDTYTNANWGIADSSMAVLGQNNTFTGYNNFTAGVIVGSQTAAQFNDSSTHYIALKASHTVTSTTFVLPPNDGSSGQFIKTDGAGNWSFASAPGGASSTLGVNQNGVSVTTPTFAINVLSPPFTATSVSAGTTAQLTLNPSSVTLQGNTFNGVSQLVQLNSAGQLPAVDGSKLLNITFGQPIGFPFTSTTSVTMFHNFGTNNILVQCYDSSTTPHAIGFSTLTLTNTSTATVNFTTTQSGICIVAASGGGGDNLGNGLSSTNTWTGQNTFNNQVTVSSNLIVNVGSAQVLGLPIFFNVLCSSTVAGSSATTSGTFVPTYLGCTISGLKSSTHHALVIANATIDAPSTGVGAFATVARDGSNLDGSLGQCQADAVVTGLSDFTNPCTLLEYDAPGDTNSHAYRAYFKSGTAGTSVSFGAANVTQHFYVIEVP